MKKRIIIRRFLKKEVPRVFVTDDAKLLFPGPQQNFLWVKEAGKLIDVTRLRKRAPFTFLIGDELQEQGDMIFTPYAVSPAKLYIENDDSGFYADVTSFSKPEILYLLKAFSGFKKRMKSGFKLFIQADVDLNDLIPDFKNYRYRDDVQRIDSKGLTRGILLAFVDERSAHSEAYALMMQSVPVVLLERKENLARYTGQHAIGCELDEASIRDIMQRAYAEERLTAAMISGAATHAARYHANAAAKRLGGLLSPQ